MSDFVLILSLLYRWKLGDSALVLGRAKLVCWNWHNGDENICYFFKCSLNFRAHALQSELHNVSILNFAKF